MKFIYKILILGMVCLISSSTYAQIQQYSEDGTTSCIDCEEKSSERGCLCFLRGHLGSFNSQIESTTEKDKWLYEQELLLAGAITGTNFFAQYNSPTGVSSDYNFENIQRGYFRNKETNALANQYFTKLDNSLKAITNYDEEVLRNATINSKILDIRKREGTVNPKYGDLKYKGKFLRAMTDAEVNSSLSIELVTRNNQRAAASEYGIRNSRLQRMLNEGYIANFLAGNLVVHYKSLDYENAIRFMTWYMIGINSKDRGVPHIPFGNPNNIFTLEDEDNESQYLQTLFARTGGNTPPLDGYTPPSFNDVTDDVALFGLALRSLPNQTTTYVNGSGKENVKSELKKYFETNKYSSEAMTLTDNLITAHTNGQAMNQENMRFSHYTAYPSNHPIHLYETGQTGGSNRIAEWNLGSTEIANGTDGFFNLTEAMRTSDDPLSFTTEGSLVRSAIELAGRYNITWGSYTDEDLGRLFNLGHSTVIGLPFGQVLFDYNLGPTLYDNGFRASQFFRSDFALQAARIMASNNGSTEGVYFDDEIILDSSFLSTNAYCVYNELKRRNGNLFRQTIGSFIDDPKYKLYFRVGECELTDEACTDDKFLTSSNVLTIKLENTHVQSLEAAALLLHEGIHAEMFRFVNEIHNGNVNSNDRKRLVELYRLYTRLEVDYPTVEAQHTYMAENYVKPIARAIRELDNNKYPLNHYMGYGWEGLKDNAHPTLLTTEEFNEFLRLKAIVDDNTDFNPNNCN
ncbi:hypothetical protein [Aquimarina algiphila]|uniref:hypothetical protein n=1 Tax=Aquimarina algiphila TaxID=2047982 RepID=UPI002491D932|nr:hypothetical protein [Aquimarina algiphila]